MSVSRACSTSKAACWASPASRPACARCAPTPALRPGSPLTCSPTASCAAPANSPPACPAWMCWPSVVASAKTTRCCARRSARSWPYLGVRVDEVRNQSSDHQGARPIHAADSAVEVWVVPTDEGHAAASEAAALTLPDSPFARLLQRRAKDRGRRAQKPCIVDEGFCAICLVNRKLVGAIGLEPTTPTMSRWCLNQLSYTPVVARKRL